jgi:hypothetical protein
VFDGAEFIMALQSTHPSQNNCGLLKIAGNLIIACWTLDGVLVWLHGF